MVYAFNVKPDETRAAQDVVADWVGQNLYREGFIDAVLQHSDANKAQSLVARFRSFFSRNKNTAQASQLPRLERLFRKGIKEIYNGYSKFPQKLL